MTRPIYPVSIETMSQSDSIRQRQLARAGATALLEAFDAYLGHFMSISQRARLRFERREWHALQNDAAERLAIRETVIGRVVAGLREMMGGHVQDVETWLAIKQTYANLIARRNDAELAETFFNSVTRRILGTVGVNSRIEFVWFGATMLPGRDQSSNYRRYVRITDTADTIRTILSDYEFQAPYADKEDDAAKVAAVLDDHLVAVWESANFESIEVLKAVFYRNKGAYLIGRIRRRNRVLPIVLPLLHDERGVAVDAVLLSEDEASRVFSFTRSYFHLDSGNPSEVVGFLKSIMPLKPIAELYTALGYHKHGKTMLYRALYRHLGNSSDRFEIARGAKGMVMTVFTLPSYDIVFKLIKDRFAEPKTTTRDDVMRAYHFVFAHDRVGRMIDAQEFENLTFERERFSEELLDELLSVAANTVTVTDGEVIIKHLYTERRLYPLDLYIKEKSLAKAKAAIIDYGYAIADLAAANIFPGDLFIKNFGVTRHGRVVFYDYDELCLLSECNFRHMPQSNDYDDEVSAQPWFSVSSNDIFPEEFRTFLWLPKPLREVLEREHGYLFQPEWWQQVQARVSAGDIMDVFPYGQQKRFRR
jgi:isocitrate dehydrogenase kinase/phosphatase